eukprot:gene15499-36475_t
MDQALCIAFFITVLGGPFVCVCAVLCSALFRYFSLRFVFSGNAAAAMADSKQSFLMPGPPHGAAPISGILCISGYGGDPGFLGSSAWVVKWTPFLRYVTLYGCTTVDKPSIVNSINGGRHVAILTDGIAGIFKKDTGRASGPDARDDVCVMKERRGWVESAACAPEEGGGGFRGIAKLALKYGLPVLPAYGFGNNNAMGALCDRWRWCEW